MGSGSSSRLTETVKANSISQEFHNSNNKSKQRYQRFSYCSIASDTNHQLTNQPSIYDNHLKQTNFNNNNNITITNKYYKFPDVASSNVNTILLPNRFKSFENFIAPNQLQQHNQQASSKQSTPDTFESTSNSSSNSSSNKLTKSLIMYDVDFEKFNRCANDSSTHRLDKLKSSHSHNRSFKTMNSVTSSIYQDLIELDKDLAKRENDLKQQQQYSSSRVSTSSSTESSSGCSSGASSSNLSVSRRKSMNTLRKNDSSLYSINMTSQSNALKTGTSSHLVASNMTNTSKRDNKQLTNQDILRLPSESQSNLSSKTSPLLTSASSTSTTSSCSNKSILSTSANLSSSCSSISSPTQYFSPKSYSKASQSHHHHHNHHHSHHKKRAQNRRSLLNKTKSECLFNNLNATQSSSSSSSTKDDDKDSIYVRQFPTVNEHLNKESLAASVSEQNTKKLNKSKLNKTNRDSGIIVDLFHLNGSMTNLKTKLNNAKMNLRNSFSVFNLKHSATSSSLNASKKSNKKKDLISSSSNTNTNINSITNSSNNMSVITQQQLVSVSDAAAVSSSPTSNKNKESNFQEFNNHNTTVSSSSSSATASSTTSHDDDNINNNDDEVIKHQNSRENFFSNNNNNNIIRSTSTTKSKLNTISSSINSFLSNLTTNSTNNNNFSNIIKNSNTDNNENCFTNSTNLVLNKNKISNIINNNDTLISNNNNINKQTNYKTTTESNCANTLSQSTTSLTASSNNSSSNNNESNYKLTRFSNSIKINENKQQKQQLQQQQQPIIKRTMTFHSTNNPTKQNETINESLSSEVNSSFKPAAKQNVSSSSSSSVLTNLNPTSVSNSTTNIKLVNSKTISSFKTKPDNLIPVVTIEKRNKQEKPSQLQQIKHSVSMNAAVDESHQQQPASKTNVLASHRHQKIVVQASTSDLLNCFSVYISEKCPHLLKETYVNPLTYMNNEIGKRIKFEPRDTINWLRSADRALLIQGWQEIAFMNPVNVVFVYLLVKETLNDVSVKTVYELQCYIMACLYLAFSYMGNEISYPLKPFLIEENRDIFWQRVCDLMSKLSSCMLRINRDPRFFTELFYELKSYSIMKKPESITKLPTSTSITTTTITPIGNNLMNNSCYKQLTDQINSIEIKIDSFSKNNSNQQGKQISTNNEDENNKIKTKTSHDKALVSSISLNNTQNNKSLIQLNESTRSRSALNNENQNPFNSYCI